MLQPHVDLNNDKETLALFVSNIDVHDYASSVAGGSVYGGGGDGIGSSYRW